MNNGGACGGTPAFTITCSDLWGNSGGDAICGIDGGSNLSLDPLFCSKDPVGTRNVAIQKGSPCAPGMSACGRIGAGDVDCTPLEIDQRSWSQIKNLYR